MKITKKFKDKKLTIRTFEKSDIKKARLFQKYINELAEDNTAYILKKSKATLKEEREFLKNRWKIIKKGQSVTLVTECDGKIISLVSVTLKPYISKHVSVFAIAILKDYRGMGLGKYLMKEILKLAEKSLKPKPKMVRLGCMSVNKPAISLYKKFGFKIVGRIPKQFNFNGRMLDEIIMIKFLK